MDKPDTLIEMCLLYREFSYRRSSGIWPEPVNNNNQLINNIDVRLTEVSALPGTGVSVFNFS